MKISLLLFALLILFALPAPGGDAEHASLRPVKNMKIRIRLGDEAVPATLRDTAAAHAFLALLPLQLDLKDYAGTEKIADLPGKLPTKGAPIGSDPSAGDIAYYVPWGNLAVFYRDFGYSKGLVILGTLDSGLEQLTAFGAGKATIEIAGH